MPCDFLRIVYSDSKELHHKVIGISFTKELSITYQDVILSYL